jgi:hypothetical protein
MDGQRLRIVRLSLSDEVARLHVEIEYLNNPLVGFCFIRSIDLYLVPLLNLKVSYVFMFCSLIKDKLKTICMFFLMI